MSARMLLVWLLLAILVLANGCKTTEVTFVAKYQHGPVNLEVHGNPFK